MQPKFELCFSTQAQAKLPFDINDKSAYEQFRRDNPHILGTSIPFGTPFILSEPGAGSIKSLRQSRPDIACALNDIINLPTSAKRNIARMANDFGDQTLLAISELYYSEIRPYLSLARGGMNSGIDEYTAFGAAATAVNAKEARMSDFGKALYKYQQSLENIYIATRNRAPKLEIIKLSNIAKQAHAFLNEKFTSMLNHFAGKVKARGNIWSNPQRGINKAISGRSPAPLQLTSLANIRHLKALEFGSDMFGKSLLALDALVRFDNVLLDKEAGRDWHKRSAMEITGFGAGGAAGGIVGTAVIKGGMGIALAAGPVGWVILIGVGLGAGYVASKIGDKVGQSLAESAYNYSSSISWF